ncbi:MAG: glycosyltransferase [bacterium]|nr:MAG: glycosyltransferase [bacterium]
MKISAHTLFKNEERWLWFSVTSVVDYVDKLLLWDTGSTDRSWDVAMTIKEKYGKKIDLRRYGEVTPETFPEVRQAMLDATDSDWFIVVDGDEIWWQESITKVIKTIQKAGPKTESIVVPTMNMVGDIYHRQPKNAGKYKFGKYKGHYNLRAIKRSISGLHSVGEHGVWGWADGDGNQIQDRISSQNRNTFKFVDAPYMHTTFLPRGESREDDKKVPKRFKKLKYEIGQKLPNDFYFPEVFFKDKPSFVPSPWKPMATAYKLRAIVETPIKKFKRRFKNEKVGY